MMQPANLWKKVLHCPVNLAMVIALSTCLLGCSAPTPAASPSQEANLGQSLQISAQVKIANQVIQLEVAKTPEQQAKGLMYRDKLADDRGMLFVFNPPRQVGFWMKNVRMNLDMVFLRNGQVVNIASDVPPCEKEPCPIYGPFAQVDQVIELRGRRAAELGLKVGDRLSIQTR